jgi:hypothetical protein
MAAREPAEASLGVVIPAWNEQENLDLLLPELTAVTRKLGIDADLIVVDGGSMDGTKDTAARHGAPALSRSGSVVMAALCWPALTPAGLPSL